MSKNAAAILQEVLALMGLGLFAFGLWQIYRPACWLFIGTTFMVPFAVSIRRVKS